MRMSAKHLFLACRKHSTNGQFDYHCYCRNSLPYLKPTPLCLYKKEPMCGLSPLFIRVSWSTHIPLFMSRPLNLGPDPTAHNCMKQVAWLFTPLHCAEPMSCFWCLRHLTRHCFYPLLTYPVYRV